MKSIKMQVASLRHVVGPQMGREALEGLRFLASLPLASTGQREGGGFSCINKRIISHPVTESWSQSRMMLPKSSSQALPA